MVIAAEGLPDPREAALCLTSLLLAAAGSAMLNGLLDAPLDRKMDRLKARVSALDTVGTSMLLAVALTCIVTGLSLALLLNLLVFLLTLSAVILYTLAYTLFLKRRYAWGAIPGGIPGALPVLIGQAAVAGSLDIDGILLFILLFLWQPPHFWVLALRYRDDYRAAGLPVLPLACGEPYTSLMILLYVIPLLPVSVALAVIGCCSPLWAAYASILWLYLLAVMCRHVVSASRYHRAFRGSIVYLVLLLITIILDVLLTHQ